MPIKPFIDIKQGDSGSHYQINSMLTSTQKQYKFDSHETVELSCSSDPDKNKMVVPVEDIPVLMNLLEDCGEHYDLNVEAPEQPKKAEDQMLPEEKGDGKKGNSAEEHFDPQQALDSLDQEEIDVLQKLVKEEAIGDVKLDMIDGLDDMNLINISGESQVTISEQGIAVVTLINANDAVEEVEKSDVEEKSEEGPKVEMAPKTMELLERFNAAGVLGLNLEDDKENEFLSLSELGYIKHVGDDGYIITDEGMASLNPNGKITDEQFLQNMIDDGKCIKEGQLYQFEGSDKRVRGKEKALAKVQEMREKEDW